MKGDTVTGGTFVCSQSSWHGDRSVCPDSDGQWEVRQNGGDRAAPFLSKEPVLWGETLSEKLLLGLGNSTVVKAFVFHDMVNSGLTWV